MTKFLSLLAIALAGAYVFITLDLLFGYTLLVLFYPQIKKIIASNQRIFDRIEEVKNEESVELEDENTQVLNEENDVKSNDIII